MTGGKKERLNLEIKLLSGASPVVVGKETLASPLVKMHNVRSSSAPPMEGSKPGLCLSKKGEAFLK